MPPIDAKYVCQIPPKVLPKPRFLLEVQNVPRTQCDHDFENLVGVRGVRTQQQTTQLRGQVVDAFADLLGCHEPAQKLVKRLADEIANRESPGSHVTPIKICEPMHELDGPVVVELVVEQVHQPVALRENAHVERHFSSAVKQARPDLVDEHVLQCPVPPNRVVEHRVPLDEAQKPLWQNGPGIGLDARARVYNHFGDTTNVAESPVHRRLANVPDALHQDRDPVPETVRTLKRVQQDDVAGQAHGRDAAVHRLDQEVQVAARDVPEQVRHERRFPANLQPELVSRKKAKIHQCVVKRHVRNVALHDQTRGPIRQGELH